MSGSSTYFMNYHFFQYFHCSQAWRPTKNGHRADLLGARIWLDGQDGVRQAKRRCIARQPPLRISNSADIHNYPKTLSLVGKPDGGAIVPSE